MQERFFLPLTASQQHMVDMIFEEALESLQRVSSHDDLTANSHLEVITKRKNLKLVNVLSKPQYKWYKKALNTPTNRRAK